MLKLVEIINTMPKRVCRVVLYAESKDDISQAALDEFQNKAGYTVAGGSFIYDSDKEISVTAVDGRLSPKPDDMYFTLDDVSSLDDSNFLRAPKDGIVHISLAGKDKLSDSELKNKMYNIIRGLLIHNMGVVNLMTRQEVIDLPNGDEETLISAGVGSYSNMADQKEIVVEVTNDGMDEYVTDDFTFGGWLYQIGSDLTFGDLRTPTFGPLPDFFVDFSTK